MKVGTIVRCRDRDWVLLPSEREEVHLLRPLTGLTDEAQAVLKALSNAIGYDIPEERVEPSAFPLPSPENIGDASNAHLLWQAARLILREGATPFRCLGRISIRPRTYQFVPLLMALRLNPVRLFIADDVGVGKTIEALLIARELYDRGEIKSLAVLCPPYLCEQWATELHQKFNLEPVLIRSGSVRLLERQVPPGKTIYEHFPIQVISIDWVKSERNRSLFLIFCPELVIVDEAHGAAQASEESRNQQERHELLRDVARDPNRHLILLTATPHSGIEGAFRSLLGLLKPEFAEWDLSHLTEAQRIELARHFIQRTRKDLTSDWEEAPPFPQRETADETYALSDAYRQLFRKTYAFCSEIVQTGQELEEWKRRVRYWGALALLRCVMSSPAAALATLEQRLKTAKPTEEEEPNYAPNVFEADEEETDDETPIPPVAAVQETLPESDRHKLQELWQLAHTIHQTNQDTKVARCADIVKRLLKEGFHPIVWCRYVATAEYVGTYLRDTLPKDPDLENVQITVITGRMGDDERRVRIQEIDAERPHVLVATDCLSEGINLQEKFTAVLHYDLPWNPNRMEQREGRVDRYGQTAPRVKAIRFYGRDNPVDGVVLRVLLDKAREIHRTLGTYVPIPEESESIMQAVLNALFLRRTASEDDPPQLFGIDEIVVLHKKWDLEAARERTNRTRFAQKAIKPDEVRKELEAADKVLGDPEAVQAFVLAAAQRLGLQVHPHARHRGVFRIPLTPEATQSFPEILRPLLPRHRGTTWLVSFLSPAPEGAEYLHRNHPFVATLARYLWEDALTHPHNAIAPRCGIVRTRTIQRLTILMLLRIRYLMRQPQRPLLLSEEVLILGYEYPAAPPSSLPEPQWLSPETALHLLATTKPDANIPLTEKQELVRQVLTDVAEWNASSDKWGERHPILKGIRERLLARAAALTDSHKRVRQAAGLPIRHLAIEPQFPPDFLGLLILQPHASS